MKMFWKWIWKALAFLLVLAVIVGGGIAIYKAGYNHGISAGMWQAEGGGDVTPPQVLPQPGRYFKPYGRPLLMFPVFGLCFGFLLLMLLFGGVRRLIHYKIWKSAGMPYPKGVKGRGWGNVHGSHFWGPYPWAWDKSPGDGDPSEDVKGDDSETDE
jgi:hypothetical protein